MKWIILLLCLAVAPVQAGKIYKWTDDNGNVHFSDRPASKAAKKITIKRHRLSPSGGISSPRRYRRRRVLRVLKEDRLRRQRARVQAARKQQVAEARCRYYRSRLENSRRSSYIYDRDASGKKRIYSSAQRQQYMQRLQAATEKWCKQ
jgi:hypothetical protein